MSPSDLDNTESTDKPPADLWLDDQALGDEIIRMAAEIKATNEHMLELLMELDQGQQQDPAGPPFTVSRSAKHYLEAAIHENVFREPPQRK
jgi:hypothetical protein